MAAEQEYQERFDTDSVGDRLRQAREARGVLLDEIANQTRIPIRHLQHIEREEWDALPAVTYCVGFVRAYANAVGLDGAELSREVRDRLGGIRSHAPAPEYYQPADPARVPPRSLAIVAAIVAAVLIVGYLVWRSSLGGEEDVATVTVPLPEEKAAPSQPQQRQPAQPPQPQNLAGQPVTLTATEEVWLRVSDAAGGTLYEGIMQPGATYQVPATAQRPVIRTGRPQVLQVSIGGRRIGPIEPVERTVSDVSLRPEDLAAHIQPGANGSMPVQTP